MLNVILFAKFVFNSWRAIVFNRIFLPLNVIVMSKHLGLILRNKLEKYFLFKNLHFQELNSQLCFFVVILILHSLRNCSGRPGEGELRQIQLGMNN